MTHDLIVIDLLQAVVSGRLTQDQAMGALEDLRLAAMATDESCSRCAAFIAQPQRGADPRVHLFQAAMLAGHIGGLVKCGRAKGALILLDVLQPLFERVSAEEIISLCLLNRAGALTQVRDFKAALAAFDRAEALFRRQRNEEGEAACLLGRGTVYLESCNYEPAIECFDRAEPIFAQLGLNSVLAGCRMNRARAWQAMGQNERAIEAFKQAEQVFVQLEEHADAAACRAQRGQIRVAAGQYEQVLFELSRAREVFVNVQHHGGVAACDSTMATACRSLGQYERAIGLLEKAESIFARLGQHDHVAACRLNRANVLHDLGRLEEAVNGFDSAEQVYSALGMDHPLAVCRMNHGLSLNALERAAQAIELFDSAERYFQTIEREDSIARCRMYRGGALSTLGEWQRALDDLGKAEAFFDRVEKADELATCRMASLYVLSCSPLSGQSVARLPKTREAWYGHRLLHCSDPTTLEAAQTIPSFASLAFNILGSQGELERAWEYTQESKGFILARGVDRKATLREPSPSEQSELRQQRTRLSRDLLQCAEEPHSRVSSAKADHDARRLAMLSLARNYVEYHLNVTQDLDARADEVPELLDAASVSKHLGEGDALIDWWMDPENPVVFVLRSGWDQPRVVHLTVALDAVAAVLTDVAGWATSAATAASAQQARATLNSLWHMLFEPVLAHPDMLLKGVTRLYLVPDSWTHDVPLHAMMDQDGRTLADRYETHYLPGASLLAVNRNAARKSPDLPPTGRLTILSIVNPERGTSMTLPFSEWEGAGVRDRLGLAPACVTMLQGQAGADVLSVSNWSNSDIVHFSCHGSAEPRFSPVSHLRIAGDVLMAHDVLYECGPMKDGAIVVLNGCQTYVKDRRSVDEGMGLATAFLARGAGMVLATLWNLNDYAGAAVVTDFLRRIIREKDEGGKPMAPAKALAAAVNALRATTWEQAVKAGRECLAMFPEGTPERAKAKLMCDHYENGQRASHDFRAPGNTRPPRVSTTGPEDASAWFEAAEPFEHPYYWAGFQLVGRFA